MVQPVIKDGGVYTLTRAHGFHALDSADGKTLWVHPVDNSVYDFAVANGSIYFYDAGTIHSWNVATGDTRWARDVPGGSAEVRTLPSSLMAWCLCLQAGCTRWTTPMAALSGTSGRPTVSTARWWSTVSLCQRRRHCGGRGRNWRAGLALSWRRGRRLRDILPGGYRRRCDLRRSRWHRYNSAHPGNQPVIPDTDGNGVLRCSASETPV